MGATASSTVRAHYKDRDLEDVNIIGHTANMVDIDTRTLSMGRYFTEVEDRHSAAVCLVGDSVVQQFFAGADPVGKTIRLGNDEFTIIGSFEKIGSVLGQDQDHFVIVPMNEYLRLRDIRFSLTLNILTAPGNAAFERAQDQARMILRARRHILPGQDEDFFIGTKDSYISLWQSISGAFFAVFLMVSSISAVVGGIVIMNVMLVSVTERPKKSA